MEDRSHLTHLDCVWDDCSGIKWKKKGKQRERAGEKKKEKEKKRLRVLERSWDLNEGEKEIEEGGDRDRNVYGGDSVGKKWKKNQRMDEMKREKRERI